LGDLGRDPGAASKGDGTPDTTRAPRADSIQCLIRYEWTWTCHQRGPPGTWIEDVRLSP